MKDVSNTAQVDALDIENFSPEFTKELPKDSFVPGPVLSSTAQAQFYKFSYNRPVAGLDDAGGSIKDPSAFGSVRDQ